MPLKLSNKTQIDALTNIIHQYLRLPLRDDTMPGSFFEGVLAHLRGGVRLNTYDFVDVVNRKEKNQLCDVARRKPNLINIDFITLSKLPDSTLKISTQPEIPFCWTIFLMCGIVPG